MPRPDRAVIESLRARIGAMGHAAPGLAETIPLLPAIDAALPWGGLPLACLHEVTGEDGAAAGFCAVLLAQLARRGPVAWCSTRDDLHPPGLAAFGLEPGRLLAVRARGAAELLWAMEECLRCRPLGAVLGEVASVDLTAGRRLQLAAEAGGVTGLLLTASAGAAASGATTRWRVSAAPSAPVAWDGLGSAGWRIALERCRNGRPAAWLVEWDEETSRLRLRE